MTQPAYDQIGRDYSTHRQTDPHIAAQIETALGDARTVLNVGAGAGSYEPAGREVVAVEPSAEMIAQRTAGAAPAVQANAESLPFDDDSFDAAMAIVSDHHWSDRAVARAARVGCGAAAGSRGRGLGSPTMSDPGERLPHIDEHSVELTATPEATWEALLRVAEGSFSSPRTSHFARLLGCADVDSHGPRPLTVGSAFPGFHVETAERPLVLALAGSHRFSDYALIFRAEALDNDRTRLRAETRATFPGFQGGVYRTLVIRTRGHVLVTRRLLGAIKQRAERG